MCVATIQGRRYVVSKAENSLPAVLGLFEQRGNWSFMH